MVIRQTICESLGEFLCAKSEITPQTQENILKWRSVAEQRHISRDLTDRFSLNFPESSMLIRLTICESLGRFLCTKSEISPQTQENISKWRSVVEQRHISRDLTDRFSLNFPDCCMAIRHTICESLCGFLSTKSEISPQTQENISKWRSVAERRHISRDLTDRFSLNFSDRSMTTRQTICESLGGFLCAKCEISPQTQENISNWRSVTERRHISRDLTDRFSLNFPDRSMTTRQTICASFNRFLCAKSEISLQTQDNISIWRCVAEHRHISVDLTDRSSLNFSDSCRAIRLTISQNTR